LANSDWRLIKQRALTKALRTTTKTSCSSPIASHYRLGATAIITPPCHT